MSALGFIGLLPEKVSDREVGRVYLTDSGDIVYIVEVDTDSGKAKINEHLSFGEKFTRPLRFSEFHNFLSARNDNRLSSLVARNYGEGLWSCYYQTGYLGSGELVPFDSGLEIKLTRRDPEPEIEEGTLTLKDLEEEYADLFGSMSEIELYESYSWCIDLLGSQYVIDLLNEESYTNTISIEEFIPAIVKSGISAKVDLSLSWSKSGEEYCKDLSFIAFRYDSEGKLVMQDMTCELSPEIRVEYLSGVISVLPVDASIEECIINNCTISYGELDKK